MRFGLLQYCIIFITIFLACSCLNGQPNSETAASNGINTDDADARQTRIYREALLQGSSQEIRIDAAVGLLLRKDSQSRQVLLSALKSQDNLAAQEAVCKALIKSRGVSQSIGAVDMFLEPLLDVLQNPSAEQAELAAEAMLAFDYAVISEPLNRIVQDSSADRQTRIHAVYAIQLRPEPSALKTLIGLLDDPDTEVAGAAERALQESFGIPVGTNRSEWAVILKELQQKNPSEIRRERLLRQEIKLRQVQAESQRWQKLYLASLNKQYELSDEEVAAAMILEKMDSDLGPVRVWALEKIVGSPAIVNEAIKDKLLSLLWDDLKLVRLQTAKTLKTMSATNPAPKLLERFSVEKDPEVALAIFEALGEACFFAFSPGSKIELPTEIKDQTLQIASEYLKSSDPHPVLISAEVFRKLLELNDIEKTVRQAYLQQLQQRYTESAAQDSGLQADLLGILAHLCGQGGSKAAACELFEPLFVESLKVEDNPALRLAAATGFAYIDKSKALELFKRYQLQNVQSASLRYIVIDVAGHAGDTTDLDWLLKIFGENGQGETAWGAVQRICQRQDTAFLIEFIPTLQSAPGCKDEYVRTILNMAEQKAAADQNPSLLIKIRQQTIAWLADRRLWDQGISYLENLTEAGELESYPDTAQINIFTIYLYGNQSDKLAECLKAPLSSNDIQLDGPYPAILRDYFNASDIAKETKQATLKAIQTISVENRPVWAAFVSEMNLLLNPPPAPKPETSESQPEATTPDTVEGAAP